VALIAGYRLSIAMNESCKVSVVIPCFNHGEFLPEAVASVISAKRDDMELIVVDDGSTDEQTRKEMDALFEQRINVVRQQNKGLPAARNAGIAASHGEYIFPLDADDRMRSGWIDRGIEILDVNPQVGVVCGDVEFFGTRTGRWHVGTMNVRRLLERNYFPCSALYRRSVWEQNGGYDVEMLQGFEDWDFWVGAVERGWQFEYMPEVFFDYRKTKESMITRVLAFEEEAAEFIARKHNRLCRKVWLSAVRERDSLATERESLKWTLRNLSRLLKARIKRKLAGA
jgi:glycosyltransferase involved in cell wall biosynthesis